MPERLTLPGHQSGKSRLLLNAALVALFIWGGSMYKNQMGGNIAPPEVLDQVSRPSDKNAIRKVEFMSLLDRKRHFSSLAKDGYYTVVEVYLDTCTLCKRLESGFSAFVKKRKDTYIRRVHFPEEGIQFSFTGTTQEEVQRQADETNALMQSYNVCGTPHVVIYGPDKQVIAEDACGGRQQGTHTLQNWIYAETGLLKGKLSGVTSIL